MILTVCFIFSNSMETANVSSSTSMRVLRLLQGLLRRLGQPGLAELLTEHIVRKAAHFCEYALEGFFLQLCLHVYTDRLLRYISWPALLGLLTALCDETIQLFYDGRGSKVTDIWIDFAGVCTGLLAALALIALCRALWRGIRRAVSGLRERNDP